MRRRFSLAARLSASPHCTHLVQPAALLFSTQPTATWPYFYFDYFVAALFPRPGSIEADENLNFLTTLQESCINLCNAAPKDIPAILKDVLTRIRMIWSVSSFFSKVEPLTGLLRKVSNQIIVQVCLIHLPFSRHSRALLDE